MGVTDDKTINKTEANPTTAGSSGISEGSSQQKLSRALIDKKAVAKQHIKSESGSEEEDEEEETENEILSSPERESNNEENKYKERVGTIKIHSIAPKDIEMKKELMSYVAYNTHLENCCKLITCSKSVNFSDNPNDKNRVYMSGNAIMSMKLTVSLAQSKKHCDQLRQTPLFNGKIRR